MLSDAGKKTTSYHLAYLGKTFEKASQANTHHSDFN